MTVWPKLEGKPHGVWLWGPRVDLLGAAGLGSLLFAAIMVPLTLSFPRLAPLLATGFLHLGALCNYPHYAATYQLIVRERGQHPRTFRHLLASTPVVIALLVAGIAWPATIGLIVRVYLTWSAYHYAAQHFGLATMYATRAGRPLHLDEKGPMRFGFIAVGAFMMLMTNTLGSGPSTNVFGANLNHRDAGSPLDASMALLLPLETYYAALALAATGLAAFLVGDRRLARRTGKGYPTPAWILFATNATWFVLPFVRAPGTLEPWMGNTLAIWVPYAIPFFHCFQYLVVTTWRARTTGPIKPTLLFLTLAALGLLLFEGTTRGLTAAHGLTDDRAVLLVPALLNIHHFFIDGIMWKRSKATSPQENPAVVPAAVA